MKNSTASKVYAKALYQLGSKERVDTAQQLTLVNEALTVHKQLVSILSTEIFTIKERQEIISLLASKLKLHRLTRQFLLFLLQEKRLHLFFSIWQEIIILDDEEKGQIRGIVQGGEGTIDSPAKKKIQSYLTATLKKKVLLEYKKSKLSAGFKVTVGDYHIDASLHHQLARFKDGTLE